MYSSKFVACVLVNGKVLQERKDGVVAIPFGADYALRFRNKHDRRAVVRFTIDGEDVSGNGYVLPAHGVIDIRRHAAKNAAFRFVSLESGEAVDAGKNDGNADGGKGVIECRFYLEAREWVTTTTAIHHHHHWTIPAPPVQPFIQPNTWPWLPTVWCSSAQSLPIDGSAYSATSTIGGVLNAQATPRSACATPNLSSSVTANDAGAVLAAAASLQDGCTVEGAASGQTFGATSLTLEPDCVTLRLVLRGYQPETYGTAYAAEKAAGRIADGPMLPDEPDRYCGQCGTKRRRRSDRFCPRCGSSLTEGS